MQDDARLLELWEGAVGRRGAARDHALLGVAPASLPERNLLAMRRYAELFGAPVELLGRCACCATTVEFTIDAADCAMALAREAPAGDGAREWHVLPGTPGTTRFRLPLPADLHALDAVEDADAFADALLDRCVAGERPCEALRGAIVSRMQEMLPGATIDFALRCPECGHGWRAPLDAVDLLWRVLRVRAERLLAEVALIARRFGWSERDILTLDPARRAAYLQLAAA